MDTLQEAVIDEVRWPRMFAKLRSAGLYSSCGCAGCGSCQAAARRFVRGVARSARWTQARHPGRWARPLVVLRSVGTSVPGMGVVVDPQDEPRIVDVDIPPSAPEESEGLFSKPIRLARDSKWEEAIRYRATWPGTATTARLLTIPALVPARSGARREGFATFANLSPVPRSFGLYLIVWPHGAYFGKGTELGKGVHGRVSAHLREHTQWSFTAPDDLSHLRQFRVYWLNLDGAESGDVEKLETRYLNTIAMRPVAERQASTPVRRAAYARAGFRNRSEVEV